MKPAKEASLKREIAVLEKDLNHLRCYSLEVEARSLKVQELFLECLMKNKEAIVNADHYLEELTALQEIEDDIEDYRIH